MTEKNVMLLKSAFTSYRSYIELMKRLIPEGNMQRILIDRVKSEENITIVSISIVDTKYDLNYDKRTKIDKYNHKFLNFEINVPLTDSLAKEFVDMIIYDFKNNHFVNYSSFNEMDRIVTFQNCRFSLRIHFEDKNEMIEAKEIYDNISHKTKVLKISK